MFPNFSLPDEGNELVVDLKYSSETPNHPSLVRGRPNKSHLVFGEFCHPMTNSNTLPKHPSSMHGVFMVGDILKILDVVILLVAILMVYAHSFLAFAKKSLRHQTVNWLGYIFSIYGHIVGLVSAKIPLWLKDSTEHSSLSRLDSTHTPKIADFIIAFSKRCRFPNFFHEEDSLCLSV